MSALRADTTAIFRFHPARRDRASQEGLSRRQFIGAATAAGTAAALGTGPASIVLSGQAPPPSPPAAVRSRTRRWSSPTAASTRWTRGTPSRSPCRSGTADSSRSATRRPPAPPTPASSISRAARSCPAWSSPRPHRQPRQPARLPHHPREHDVDPRDPGGAGRAAEGRARRAVDHVDGRLASRTSGPSIGIRRCRSSTRRFPIGRCCSTSASPARARRTAWARRSSTPPTPRRRCTRTS